MYPLYKHFYKDNKSYYTEQEVSKHNKENDIWVTYSNKVYDITKFIEKHPIGSEPLVRKAGTDCTVDYDFHSKAAKQVWKEYKIGYVNKPKESCCIIS